MNLDHDFVQVSKLSEDQKTKRSSPKMEHFFALIQVKTKKKVFTKIETLCFANSDKDQKKRSSPKAEHFSSPNSSGYQRSDTHQSQNIGGDTVNLLGGIYSSHPLQVSASLFEILRPARQAGWTPVKLSFLATKRHLSTNRNIHIYFIINTTFYKKMVFTNQTF